MNADQIWNHKIQTATIAEALFQAQVCFRIASMLSYFGSERMEKRKWRFRGHAFLNRACDLACVKLETKGWYGWYTRTPRVFGRHDKCITSLTFIGTLAELNEEKARSMALGY